MAQFGGNPRNYYSRNYNKALEILIPDFYLSEELEASGAVTDVIDQVINKHILIADNGNTIFNVSSTENYGPSSFDTYAPYFIKQNNLTRITPFDFERKILFPIGKTYSDFSTSSEFQDYLNETLLPKIVLNSSSLDVSTENAYASTASGTHEYLIQNLSWYYILNQSGAWSWAPSSLVSRDLASICYEGNTITIADSMKAINEYVWRNQAVVPEYVPQQFLSGTGEYVSGIQQLEKLNTITDRIYKNDFFDNKDSYIKDAFEQYNNLASLLDNEEANGPLTKFLKAVGFSIADIQSEVENIRTIFDIENCPDEFLPDLAELIGWRLIGSNPDRWRRQIRGAIQIYKAKGTKRSIQLIVNTIFGDNVFDVSSSNIVELYESYIPNLIYYALATDSVAFENEGINWTESVAESLGVQEFSRKGVDYNLRLAVDYILLELVQEFPNLFFLGPNRFDITDPNFIFNYRGRDFPIPPWEEEKYYQNCNITNQFLDYLNDKLRCYGVSESLADSLIEYIIDNTLNNEVIFSTESQWVFFTSSIQYPPNYAEVLRSPTLNRSEYLPLWNGRSSHFSMLFDATSFDFSKIKDETPDSPLALRDIVLGVDQVIPAHSIPNIVLSISDAIETVSAIPDPCLYVEPYAQECRDGSAQVITNYGVSGANMAAGNKVFKRPAVDDINDSLFHASPINVPRNTLRRRNYKNLIPKLNFYTRSGFNMPHTLDPSNLYEPQINLGYNFSAGEYVPIPDPVSSLPEVYSICNTLNSPNSFNGIDVSTTFPNRGLASSYISSACNNFVDRVGPPLVAMAMFNLQDRALYAEASSFLVTSSVDATPWFDWVGSNYNYLNRFSPSTFDFYEDFEFGRGIHQIYKDYTTYFDRHSLNASKAFTNTEVSSIVDYVFGPYFRNANLDFLGSAIDTDPSLDSSSLDSINFFTTSSLFNNSASDVGTIQLSDGSYSNVHVLSGVDMIMPSGTANNKMAYITIDESYQRTKKDNYTLENPIVYFKTVSKIPRLVFNDSNKTESKFLIPERDFQLDINTFGGKDDGFEINGYQVGVIIRTNEESDNKLWIFNRDNVWERISASSLTTETRLSRYSHIANYQAQNIITTSSTGIKCIDLVDTETSTSSVPFTVQDLTRDRINTFSLVFNTKNKFIAIPDDYYRYNGQLHRLDQNYIVEVFMVPKAANINRYMLLDSISIKDKTNYDKADVTFMGVSSSDSFNIKVTKKELIDIFRFFKDISKDKASRIASITSGTFETSGGGRLNYKVNPDWVGTRSSIGLTNNLSSIDFNGV